MMSLAHGGTIGDNLAVATLDETCEVRLNLSATHCPVLMDGIYLAIVVKEDRQVVDVALKVDVLSWAFGFIRNEHLHSVSIDI